jgi:hypothetical protein
MLHLKNFLLFESQRSGKLGLSDVVDMGWDVFLHFVDKTVPWDEDLKRVKKMIIHTYEYIQFDDGSETDKEDVNQGIELIEDQILDDAYTDVTIADFRNFMKMLENTIISSASHEYISNYINKEIEEDPSKIERYGYFFDLSWFKPNSFVSKIYLASQKGM